MKFKSFTIKNFKGIENLKLDLNSNPKSNIFTLIGLNESGKTTILEAINYFGTRTTSVATLSGIDAIKIDTQSFIPINKIDNFNGVIEIKAELEFENNEWTQIKEDISKKLNIKITNDFTGFPIIVKNKFENSVEKNTINEWELGLVGKLDGQKTSKKILEGDWQKCAAIVSNYLPEVLYFPNVLFDFPDKIYLEPFEGPTKQYRFYKALVQDILDSLNNKLDIQTHIIDRAVKGDASSRRQIAGVLLKMSANVTELVFGSWNKIFNKQISKKEVTIDWDTDTHTDEEGGEVTNAIYLQFLLRDGDSEYRISERSLGFRWFFVFLLLTQFRNTRLRKSRKVIFLFDEPASNLHSAAQTQLLGSFEKLGNVIYTTHSHHLVNPQWLENTYVVKNEGLSYEKEEDSFSAKKTKVTLFPYRSFVVNHPNQTTYFQPILDVLEYYPSRLENVPSVVITEGKNDYYTLLYMEFLISKTSSLKALPGTSAAKLDTPIQLYLAWGRNFIVLLDSDKEGRIQKKRYIDAFGYSVESKVFTLEDINATWKEYSCESLFTESEKLKLIQSKYPSATVFDKSLFNRAIQENLINKIDFIFSKATLSNFTTLINFCKAKLE